MAKDVLNPTQWKPGQSGNPKGRPKHVKTLTEMLRASGEALVLVGDRQLEARDALEQAVWQFALNGEVSLMGKHLEAHSVGEWASVVKWLYEQVEPGNRGMSEAETELVVHVVREVDVSKPLPQTPSLFGIPNGEGEQDDPDAVNENGVLAQIILAADGIPMPFEPETGEEFWL